MSEQNTHVLVFGRGYWGRGADLAEAVKNAKWLNKGDAVVMADCPDGTRVDEMGRIYTPKDTRLGECIHGKLGGTKAKPTFIPNAVQPA